MKDLIKKLKDGEQMHFALTPDAKGTQPKLSFDKKAITKDEGNTVFGVIARSGDTFTLTKTKGGKFSPALLKDFGKLAPDKTFVEGASAQTEPMTDSQTEAQLAAKKLIASWKTEVQAKFTTLSLTPQQELFPKAFVASVSAAASTGDPASLDKAEKLMKMMRDMIREQGMNERESVEDPIKQSMGQAVPTDEMRDMIQKWQAEVIPFLDDLILTPQHEKLVPLFDQMTRGEQADPDKADKILKVFLSLVNEARLSGLLRATPEEPIYANAPGNLTPEEPIYANAPGNLTPEEPIYANVPGNLTPEEPIYANAPGNLTPDDPPIYANAPDDVRVAPSGPGEKADPAPGPAAPPKRAPNGQLMDHSGETAADHAAEFKDKVSPHLKDLLPQIAEARGLEPGSPKFTNLINMPGELEALGKNREADPKRSKGILAFFLHMMAILEKWK